MQDLKERTKVFGVAILKFAKTLKRGIEEDHLREQLVRAGTSIGAHYRAAQRSKSDNDFLYKITLALEESDESQYWLQLLRDSDIVTGAVVNALEKEAGEFTAMFCSMTKKLKDRGVGRKP